MDRSEIERLSQCSPPLTATEIAFIRSGRRVSFTLRNSDCRLCVDGQYPNRHIWVLDGPLDGDVDPQRSYDASASWESLTLAPQQRFVSGHEPLDRLVDTLEPDDRIRCRWVRDRRRPATDELHVTVDRGGAAVLSVQLEPRAGRTRRRMIAPARERLVPVGL